MILFIVTYKCRACGNNFQIERRCPQNRTTREVVAESTMSRPNPLIYSLSFHECIPHQFGIGDIVFIEEKTTPENQPE